MKFEECVSCGHGLVCMSNDYQFGWCSSLKRIVLARGKSDHAYLAPKNCPMYKSDMGTGRICAGDYGNSEQSECGRCEVTMAAIREKLAERKEKRDG